MSLPENSAAAPSPQSDALAQDIPPTDIIRDRLRRITVEASLLRRLLRLAERRDSAEEKWFRRPSQESPS